MTGGPTQVPSRVRVGFMDRVRVRVRSRARVRVGVRVKGELAGNVQ